MGKVIAIVSDGTIRNPAFIRRKLDEMRDPIVICADGAARHLHQIDLIPSFIMGDMDSVDAKMLESYEKKGSTILRFPTEKDETDTQLALEYALTMEPEEIWIFGALGGRIDHTLANISLLVMGAQRGVTTKIVEETCELFIVTDSLTIDGAMGQTISLLPLSSRVTGITLEGFEYPLTDGSMEIGRPYGISNRLIAGRGRISVGSGHLLVIRYFRQED